MSQITIKNLSKNFKVQIKETWFINRIKSIFFPIYKEINAVKEINLTIKAWEKIAFLWPNWAWKSTTIKMLSWILSKTSWEINILWLDPEKDRQKLVYQIWAVFGQTSRLWYHLTPKDTFLLFWKMFEINKEDYEKRINYLIKEFEIESFLNTPVRKLSLGQRMRCEVVASLIHNPKILFLDEPTIWLDMIAKQKLRDVINKINKEENTTIFLTSHDIWDVEEICDRIIIINYWKVIYDWDIKDLKKNHIKTKIVKIKFEKKYDNFNFWDDTKILLNEWNYLELEIKNNKEILASFLKTLSEKYEVEDINISEAWMEDIIKTFY